MPKPPPRDRMTTAMMTRAITTMRMGTMMGIPFFSGLSSSSSGSATVGSEGSEDSEDSLLSGREELSLLELDWELAELEEDEVTTEAGGT